MILPALNMELVSLILLDPQHITIWESRSCPPISPYVAVSGEKVTLVFTYKRVTYIAAVDWSHFRYDWDVEPECYGIERALVFLIIEDRGCQDHMEDLVRIASL